MQVAGSSSRSASVSGSGSPSMASTSTGTGMPGTGFMTPIFMSGHGKERDVSVDQSESTNGQINVGVEADQGNAEAAMHGNGNGMQVESEDSALLEHLYQRGFINGEYADIQLHYRPDRQPFKMHSIVVALSPTLASLLAHPHSLPQSRDIFLSLSGHDEITDEALWIALGYLYSTRSLGQVNPSNAHAVLSASLLLQLPKLAYYAATVCKESIESIVSPQQVRFWVSYLDSADNKPGKEAQAHDYWTELRRALMHRLVTSLPASLNAFSADTAAQQQMEAQTILQHIYSVLSFNTFKEILESPLLGAEGGGRLSDQTRFSLAKKCVNERKKLSAAAGDADFEETVVLAFGGATGGSNVNIVRRPKQNRKLWKVSG